MVQPLTDEDLAEYRAGLTEMRAGISQPALTADDLAGLLATIDALKEQLHRSATVCPKDGCMLWRGHKIPHMTSGEIESMRAEVLELRAKPSVTIAGVGAAVRP